MIQAIKRFFRERGWAWAGKGSTALVLDLNDERLRRQLVRSLANQRAKR